MTSALISSFFARGRSFLQALAPAEISFDNGTTWHSCIGGVLRKGEPTLGLGGVFGQDEISFFVQESVLAAITPAPKERDLVKWRRPGSAVEAVVRILSSGRIPSHPDRLLECGPTTKSVEP